MYSSSNDTKEKAEKKIKETEKVFGYVFDRFTLLNIYKLFTDKTLERFEFPIASGKESLVFAASSEGDYYAVKIYKTVASTFKNIERYAGERWNIKTTGNRRKFVVRWAFREFRNLSVAHSAGVPVPKPISVSGNVLVMQYLGSKKSPSPLMKDVEVNSSILELALKSVRQLYLNANLVHGDLSEYNFLIYRKRPYMIDMAQAVSSSDPANAVLLRRDVKVIINFFNRFGFNLQEENVLKYVTGEKDVFN